MTAQQIKDSKEGLLKNARLCCQRGYLIFVYNSIARSFNTNIDSPTLFCFALSQAEAVGIMMLSDFEFKHKPITKINVDL